MMRFIAKLAGRFMATCQESTEHCTDHVEGALPDAERVRIERHLRLCSACRAYRDQTATGVRTLQSLPKPEISQAERDALLRRFKESRPR